MFSFVKNRVTFYVVSLALFVFSLVSPWIFGLNEGIDMTGGIQIEYQVTNGDVEAMMTQTRNELID